MTRLRRIGNLLLALVMLLLSIIMMANPGEGYKLLALILGLTLLFMGIRSVLFYFSMAKNMVGGKSMFYTGIIVFDCGIFLLSMTDMPRIYVIAYLVGLHAFSGAVRIMRALEAKGFSAPGWKWTLFHGAVDVLIAVSCIINFKDLDSAVITYATGVAFSGIARMRQAFRRTSMMELIPGEPGSFSGEF